MKNIYAVLIFFISISLFSQDEKKLALVIGNANYDKGELKNPVNDARLIASTLDSLDFEVLLHENLETRRDMTAAIRDFGTKLPDYDVSFIYYAGHGIQINSENFLLPTKEVFEMEIDVEDYGVSVQRILKYIETEENKKINILVIDACRDNPFEANWNATRSLKSAGLAKINPPTGSIIAFSTDSGNTAPDGDGENSIYTTALSKNLLRGGVSIEQVFKYVREDVLNASNGIQKPIENNTLIGDPYIINKTQISLLQEELYDIWYNNVSSNGFGFYDIDILENINNKLIEIVKLDKNNLYVDWFNTMIAMSKYDYISANKDPNFDLILNNLEKLNSDDLDFKNYVDYLKYRALNLEVFKLTNNVEYRDKSGEDYAIIIADKAFNQWKKIINFDPKNIHGFNSQSNKEHVYLISSRSILVGELYYFLSSYDNTLNVFDLDKNRLNQALIDGKEIYAREPNLKTEISEALAFLETNILITKEKLNFDYQEVQSGWRNLYKKYENNTNLLINRIYKVLSLYEFELAVDLINKTISLNPDDPEPYYILSYIYSDKKDYSSALMNINFSLERYTDDFYISDLIKYIGPKLLASSGYDNIENNKISPWELRVDKAEILGMLDNKVMMCEEYSKVLELIYETGNDELFEKYSNMISEKCDTK